jgi:hypothetical protein
VATISDHEEARKLAARVDMPHPPAVLRPEYASLAAQGAFRLLLPGPRHRFRAPGPAPEMPECANSSEVNAEPFDT